MVRRTAKGRRQGSIMPWLVFTLVSLLAFLALAIDVGMIAVARNQCQNAADVAAMVGARTLTGDASTNYNAANAPTAAATAAEANQVLSQPIQASQVSVQLGSYSYDSTQQKFVAQVPQGVNQNPTVAQVTVTYAGQTSFARVLGISGFNVSASATAVHRPRDVAVLADMSGSMRFSTLLGLPRSGTRTSSSNPEGIFPLFGQYSNQSAAALQNTTTTSDSAGNVFAPANWTEADSWNNNAPPIVTDFYQTTSPSAVLAFSPAPSSYATTPGGDQYLHTNKNTGAAWATDVADYLGTTNKDSNYESNGHPYYVLKGFQGYTQGPSYWGKTFFFWPPDPRPVWDWRQKFFIDAVTGQRVTLNARIYDSQGNWLAPGSATYQIDYQAILQWIMQSPNPFPPQLRAGRILYYSAMPNASDSTLNNRFWTQWPLTDHNERFWKEYIDYVLGVQQVNSNNSWQVITPYTGYGDDFSWGTTQINTSFSPGNDSQKRYMDYTDNPKRARLHFWFGPMSMIDFISNYNLNNGSQFCWMPGTAHEVPLYACKLGLQAALQDAQINHPNDDVSLIIFSTPQTSASDTSGRFNRARAPLGQSYSRMTSSLWFPLSTLDNPGTTINTYDPNNLGVPRAGGETCYAMGLMLAYNQFSGNASLQTYNPSPAPPGDAGGLGRQGAQKIVILETDGLANTTASANFTNLGPYNSYYNIRTNSTTPSAGEFPTGVNTLADNDPQVTSQIYTIVSQLCARDTASLPGYSKPAKPVLVHCIALGPIFSSSSPSQAAGLATLQQIQYLGNTQASSTTPLPAYKIILSSGTQMSNDLRAALKTIFESDVCVSLID